MTDRALQESLGMTGAQSRQAMIFVMELTRALKSAGRKPRADDLLLASMRYPVLTGAWMQDLETQLEPYLLALPMTGCTIALLADLARTSRRRMLIEATPLSSTLIRPLLLSRAKTAVDFLPPGAMLQRHRAWTAGKRERETYVTFPDHHTAPDDCCMPIAFFGAAHCMPLLEPLLCLYRGLMLLTLAAPSDDKPLEWRLVRFEPASAGTRRSPTAARDLLRWLSEHLQDVLRRDPVHAFSWASIRARSRRVLDKPEIRQAKIAEGVLRSWRLMDPGADVAIIASATAALAALASYRAQHEGPPAALSDVGP